MRDDQATAQSETILPGQIWLVEHDPDTPLSVLDSDVLAQANAVLFDRALGALVAEMLPLGSYAEPLPFTGSAIAPRALDLAAEGWSVVQLVAAHPNRRALLHTVWPRTNASVQRSDARAHAFTANGLAG